MIDPQVAYDKISGFESALFLANFLVGEGIKGTKISHDSCPLSEWLKKTTGWYSSAASDVVMHNPTITSALGDFHAPSTFAMIDFMNKFDRGEYPELVA